MAASIGNHFENIKSQYLQIKNPVSINVQIFKYF